MEDEPVSTGPREINEAANVSSNPSNTSEKETTKTITQSGHPFSHHSLKNAPSNGSHTSLIYNASSQQAPNASSSHTSQNGFSKTSAHSHPPFSNHALNNVPSQPSHASSKYATPSQHAANHKHKHARECQSSLFMNELEREKEASRSRTELALNSEEEEKPKLLRPKKDTVIPMMLPSSSVAPETRIMRKPNAWMRRMFAHPHRRVSPTSGRIVERPTKAVSSVNETARYIEYNKVQDPMLNHAAYIEAHRARIHKIVRNTRGVVDTGPPQTMGKYISKWKVKQRWQNINIMRDNFWLYETLLRSRTEYDHLADQRRHLEHKIAMEKRLRDAKIYLRTYKGYRNVKVGHRLAHVHTVIKYNGLQGPDVRTSADPRY